MNHFDKNKNLDTTGVIYYNYEPVNFHKTQYEKTAKNGGYVKHSFKHDERKPNLQSNYLTSGYKTIAMYVSPPIIPLKDQVYDGLLILENIPITNGVMPVFFCIPLVSTAQQNTPIDSFIAGEDVDSLNLNKYLIEHTPSIVYTSPGYMWNQEVIVYTLPIQIKTQLKELITVDPALFHNSAEEYRVVPIKRTAITEPFVEGLSKTMEIPVGAGSTKTAYCQPVDETDPEVSQKADLVVPLEGKYSPNAATNSMIRMILNFMTFAVLIVLTFMGAPLVYNLFIIQLILANKDLKTGQEKLNRLRSVDIFVGLVFVLFAFTLMTGGVAGNRIPQILIGFLILMFYGASVMRIQLLKSDESAFTKPFGNAYYSQVRDDFGTFLSANITYLFYTKLPVLPGETEPVYKFNMGSVFTVIIGFFTIFLMMSLMKVVKYKKIRLGKNQPPLLVPTKLNPFLMVIILILSMVLGIYAKFFGEKR